MRTRPLVRVAAAAVFAAAAASAPAPGVDAFRRGNEAVTEKRFDDAIARYAEARSEGAVSPSLYWNWGHAASSSGRRAEALWAFSLARLLDPIDPTIPPQVERLRSALALDSVETSLGFWRELSVALRSWRVDGAAAALLLLSIVAATRPAGRRWGLFCLVPGLVLAGALFASEALVDRRAVVVDAEATLLDAPREDALAMSRLREGEFVPLLATEGEFARVQDASGARGYVRVRSVRELSAAAANP